MFGVLVNYEGESMRSTNGMQLRIAGWTVLPFLIGLLLMTVDSEAAGPWKGQVVDRETKMPIEGAVVLMVWYKHYSLMDQTRQYYDSEEMITGPDGRFTIGSRWSWNIFVFLDRPEIYIFKAGYGKWQIQDYGKYVREKYGSDTEQNAARLTGDGAVLELPRSKTREERLRMLRNHPLLVPGVRWPKYLDAINRESIDLGLEPTNPQ